MKDSKLVPARLNWMGKYRRKDRGRGRGVGWFGQGVVAILGCWQSAVTRVGNHSSSKKQCPS
jgi:hypothetical protein